MPCYFCGGSHPDTMPCDVHMLEMAKEMERMNMPKESSVPLSGGGDAHFHEFKPRAVENFVATTRIPIGDGIGTLAVHDYPLKGITDFGMDK